MWELECEESWVLKNWCFWTVVLEKTLESPLDCKELQPVHPKGNQSWVFIGRSDVEAETPKLWPPDEKSWLIWKDPDAGKDWGQEEKGTTEDEIVGWHHWLSGHEFGWAPEVGVGQGGLACCSSQSCKQTRLSDWTDLHLGGDLYGCAYVQKFIRTLCYSHPSLEVLSMGHQLENHCPDLAPLFLCVRNTRSLLGLTLIQIQALSPSHFVSWGNYLTSLYFHFSSVYWGWKQYILYSTEG